MHGRHFHRLVERERREDARHPPRHHRLSGARRPDDEKVVASGAGDLDGATRQELTADVGEVRAVVRRILVGDRKRCTRPRRGRHRIVQCRDGIAEREPGDERVCRHVDRQLDLALIFGLRCAETLLRRIDQLSIGSSNRHVIDYLPHEAATALFETLIARTDHEVAVLIPNDSGPEASARLAALRLARADLIPFLVEEPKAAAASSRNRGSEGFASCLRDHYAVGQPRTPACIARNIVLGGVTAVGR